uniref:Uncharacterized protein n=3 Tax=Viruses TaxID=10239 RepID=A0A8S5UPF8_9CAUD|nr:MAG TPA: hypothetical protein [Podoviridae sp. ctsNK10]DAE29377.1 MAG TPA: hypothetical protein [virus sp. ctx9V1]DAE35262.1 MAG TPA: hypothetical protein [Caudoviricetes sp.]DAF96373.1 MAG TPA: hypothetical protein [Podoviridae sp. ctG4L18]
MKAVLLILCVRLQDLNLHQIKSFLLQTRSSL